jgi:hypothetical protein
MTKAEALQLARDINADAKQYREAISAAIIEPDTKDGAYAVNVTVPHNPLDAVRINTEARRRYYVRRNTLPSRRERRIRVYSFCRDVVKYE